MSDIDETNHMPDAASTTDAQLGNALMNQMSGTEGTAVDREVWTPEPDVRQSSDLESVIDANAAPAPELAADGEPVVPTDAVTIDQIELKVKGSKEPIKIPKNWEDPKVQELLNKGARFDVKMREMAQQSKDLEAKIKLTEDYSDKAEIAERVESARRLLENGHKEHALSTIFGENTEAFIQELVNERVAYESASPEKRLQLDLQKQKNNEQLRSQNDTDRIAKLEAQINARSAQVQEAEFTGYLEDANSRYDLNQWVEDADVASNLNEMLRDSAMADIIRIQRSRESKGEANITQRDIRRIYANKAKRLVSNQDSSSSKIADKKVAAQSEVAVANAQVASTRNYGQASIESEWKKNGGSMSELVDLMRGR